MAKSDEEKVATALAAEVEEPKAPADTPDKPDQADPVKEEPTAAEAADDQAKPETPADEAATFTKPPGYEWVKGDNLEEFNKNLIAAYENSTAEALRLRQVAQPAQPTEQPAAPAAPASESALSAEQQNALQYAQAMQQGDMVKAFDEFAKSYPQAREPQAFDQFTKASDGAARGFAAAFGRPPSYPELFEKTAQLLSWQPSDKNARKDAAIKDAASFGNTQASAPAPQKPVTIHPKTLEILKRNPAYAGKSDTELVKELSEIST